MKKFMIQAKLPVSILREGKRFVAYTPAFDLSTSGKTHSEAKKRFTEAVNIFLQEIVRMGTLESVLLEYGWQKVGTGWQPPVLISQELESVVLSV